MDGEYSKVNYPALRKCKKIYKINPSLYIDFLEKKIEFELKNNSDGALGVMILFMEGHYPFYGFDSVYGSNINYYIESTNLFNLFQDTEIKFNKKDILSVIDKNINYNEPGRSKVFYGWIHSKSISRSILFMFLSMDNLETYLSFSDGEFESVIQIDDMHLFSKENKIIKLILNMFFYMSAFPENVLNKPPDVVCDKLNINNSKTISMSKEIAEYLHENRDVSPHLRRGHFRYLGSDHYTKKRGQTIFVKSSFVKGHAVTVVENEKSVSTMIS
jgi:hypothetical protein